MKKTVRILTFLFIFTFIFSINVFAETVDYQGASYDIITVGNETIAVLDRILDNFNIVVVPKEVSGHLVKDVSNQIDGSYVTDITFKNWSNIADKFDFTKFPNLEDIKIEQDTFAYGDSIGNFYSVSDNAIIRTYEHTRLYDKLQDMIYEEGAKSFVLDGNTYGEAPEFVYSDENQTEIIGINRSGITTLSVPAGSVKKFSPFPYNSTNLNQCDYFGMDTVNKIEFFSSSPIEIYDLDKFKNLSNVCFFTELGIGSICEKYGLGYENYDYGSPFYKGSLFEYEEIEGTNNIKITKYLPGQPGNDLKIPSEIDGKTVTCIGSEFNFDTGNNNRYIDIESVYIPVTVTTIEDGAFSHAYVHNFVFDGHSCDVINWNSLIKFIHGIQVLDLPTNIYLNENTNIETDLRDNVTGNYTIKGFDDIQIVFEKPNQKILKGDTWSWIDEDYRIVPDLPIDSSLLTWSSDNENVVVYNTEYNYLTIKGAGKAKITLTYKNVQAEMNIEVLDGIGTNNIKMGSYSSEVQIIYYVYLGEPVEPHIYITDSNYNLLEEGKDYELVYSDNEAKGTGHVTINFLGDLKVCIRDGNDYIVQDSIVKDFYIIDPTDPMDEWGNIIGMFVVNPLEKKTYNYGETIVMTADGYNTEDGESFTVQFGNKQFTFNKESDGKYYARVLVDDSLYLDNANYPYTYYPMRHWVNNRVEQLDNGTWREVYGSYNADEIKFTLNPKPSQIVDVTKIETDENGMNLVVGETGTFHIRVFPENATNQNVTWSSSDPTIASVDNNGVVTAHKVGEVFITATSDDNENITVTNKVFVNAPVFTVSLHLNGGTLPGDLNIPVNGGSTLTEPHPEKTGYAIAGWYTDEGFNNQYTFDTPIIGNMDLYVKWEVELYNITYNLDGGTHPSPQNPLVYTIESDDITLGAPTKEGYEFVGWIESEGDEPALTITIPKGSTGNRFFTAVWSKNYDVYVGDVQVSDKNKNDVLNDGGKVTFNSETNTLNFDDVKVTTSTKTVLEGRNTYVAILSKGIDLTITGKVRTSGGDVAILSQKLNGNGGDLILDGDIYAFLSVRAEDDLIIKSGSLDAGMIVGYNTVTIKSDVTNVVSAGDIRGYTGITIEPPLEVQTGQIIKYNDEDLYYYVGDGRRVEIYYLEKYDLYVGGIQVTGANKGDVLGDGKVTFDPETNTLNFDNATISYYTSRKINGRDENVIITSDNMNLTLKGTATIGIENNGYSNVYITNGNLTLDGNFNVYRFITVENGDILISSGSVIVNVGYILAKNGTITIGSNVTRVEAGAINGFGYIGATNGITLESPMSATTPENGKVSYDEDNVMYFITKSDGSIPTKTVVEPSIKYTVTFDLDGGTIIGENPISVTKGQKVTRPSDPVKEGYTFVGWYTTDAYNEAFDFETMTIMNDTTIYAKFKTHIAELRFESTDLTVPALGKLTKNNDMNFERKVPENINIEMLNPVWIKQENGMTSDKFQVGHYNLSVRVNLHENAEYAIDSNTKLYINGIEYTVQPGSATFDHLIFFSPLYTVEDEPIIDYQIQVKNEGWHTQDTYNGKSAMRENAGNLQQAMTIDIPNKPYEGSIEYRVHIENVGWMPWVKDGEVAGIEGTALRTEALQIRLTGEMADHYDVYYRTHVQNNGWMSWAKNGEASGSSGAGLRIEGIQIKLVKKGDPEPDIFEYPSDKSYPFHEQVNVIYMGHIENKGDVGTNYLIRNGKVLGFENQKLRVEGIKVFIESTTPGTIEYTTHVEKVGWTDVVDGRWNTSGEFCGRKGQGLRVEGVKIRLTDELATKFNIFYCVKVEGQKGWQGWAKNGEEAGSMGYGKKLEAIKVVVLPKGDPNEGKYTPNPSPMLKP